MKKAALVLLALTVPALSGCADAAAEEPEDFVPASISEKEVKELEELVLEEYPRGFTFPGQEYMEFPAVIYDRVLEAGQSLGWEPISDDGDAELGGDIILEDLTSEVQLTDGQPIEMNIKLKWWGDPGASADLDICTDVPGQVTCYSPDFDDESWNWNIMTKTMVVNTVYKADQPFMVGVQATGHKNWHPDGMRYTLQVEMIGAADVLAPRTPYALTLPEGATGFIVESEPLKGSDHIQSYLVIVDPNDQLRAVRFHDDISTESLFISALQPGEYIFYVAEIHGGFLRVETDVPNPEFQVRQLELTSTDTSLGQDVVASPAAPDTLTTSALTIDGNAPLDIVPWIRTTQPGSLRGDLEVAILSADGVVRSVSSDTGTQGEYGRVGPRDNVEGGLDDGADPDSPGLDKMIGGDLQVGLRGNGGLGVALGYTVLSYQR